MTALHPVMAQVVRPFAPPASDADRIAKMQAQLRKAREDDVSLLRLPFRVEVESQPATRLAEAEYTLVTIDEDLVREAVDWLIDRNMGELEAKALELQRMRWDEQREDRA
jgi:hypothetical protein